MVNTTPPRRYRFSISRFEAYEGQNEIHTPDKDQSTTPRAGGFPISNRRYSTPFLSKENSVDDEFGNGNVKDLEALRSSFRPSRISFLRDMLGGRITYSYLSREAELDDENAELGPLPPRMCSEIGPGDCSPERVNIPETSRRFSEILAGCERPSPRAKYKSSRYADRSSHDPAFVVDVESGGMGGGKLELGLERVKTPMATLGEEGIAMERPRAQDSEPSFGKLDLETKKRRVAMIRRRRFSMMMKTSSVWASGSGSF